MKIIQHLATKGKKNVLELGDVSIETLHTQSHHQVKHEGWVLSGVEQEAGKTKGGNDRKPKRVDVVFTPAEAERMLAALPKMLERFKSGDLQQHITLEVEAGEDDETDQEK